MSKQSATKQMNKGRGAAKPSQTTAQRSGVTASALGWQQLYQQETRRTADEDKWQTPEGIAIKPLYTAADVEQTPHQWPGFAPFLRGPYASMYRGRPWTIRQYAGFSSAEESNKFYRQNLAQGQRGLSVAFDLATHRGYDSDATIAGDDVGMSGVAVDSVEDMKVLFAGIPLQQMSVSMTMNGAVIPIMANFIVAGEEQGVSADKLSGTIQNDILKEFFVRNTYIYPPQHSMRLTADIIEYTTQKMPKFNSISISGYHIQEAGATAVQEIAFTLADGIEYVRSALSRGLLIESFSPRLSFFFGIGMNFFMEVAKLRAARVLWAEIMENKFSATSAKAKMLRTHCQTSGVSLMAQDPYNNIIRTTIEAMAAVFGGTQSLHTNALDEAVSLPSEFSARLARNTQLVLQEESGITRVIDPLAGSYYVEYLTNQLYSSARAEVEKIEAMGGMIAAIADGYPKRQIEVAAIQRQARIDKGDTTIVGVNRYQSDAKEELDILRINNQQLRQRQCEKLTQLRANRDNNKCNEALLQLQQVAARPAGKDSNILQAAIAAARARATVGEISQALAKVFSRYQQSASVSTGIYDRTYGSDRGYRQVKQQVQNFRQEFQRRPLVYIAKLGQDGHDRGARVVASALQDLGFAINMGDLFQTPEQAVAAAVKHDVDLIGVSTLAGSHNTMVPKLLARIAKSTKPEIGVVIGGVVPQQDAEKLLQQGVLAIYGPGTAIPRSAIELISIIRNRLRQNIATARHQA